MTETLYRLHPQAPDDESILLTPAEGAIVPTAYDRRILVSALLRQLTELHEKVTGPRDRIGADLTHNARDAAAGIFGTLHRLDPEAAAKFAKDHGGTPYAWSFGPVVDSEGYDTEGLYRKRRQPATSPPAYSNRYRVGKPITERDRILDQEAPKLLRHLRLIGCTDIDVRRPCTCGLSLRWNEKTYGWEHLAGEPECDRFTERVEDGAATSTA